MDGSVCAFGLTSPHTYLGDQLTHMTVDGHTLYFTYDASGTPLAMVYDGLKFYYITNLQGDVISIVNGNGTEFARYTYDAWGNVTTDGSATNLRFYNPLRYRGYVYDEETGLYYLQSRYYDPKIGRFINGDGYAATGQGLLGNNMFAYCGNNPVNNSDPTGRFWHEIWEFTKAIFNETSRIMSNASDAYAYCRDIGQADGSMLAGDVIGVAGAGLITIGALGLAIYNVATAPSSSIFDSDQKKSSIPAEIGSIASGFGNFKCKEATAEIAAYLKRNNKHGNIITITYIGGKGFIWSEIKRDVISRNGVHVGVEYNGSVYCNVHPYGLPGVEWVEDFDATGYRQITAIPF